jgi:hypothetical protein
VTLQFLGENPKTASPPVILQTDPYGEVQFDVPNPMPALLNVRVVLTSEHWHCGCWVLANTSDVRCIGELERQRYDRRNQAGVFDRLKLDRPSAGSPHQLSPATCAWSRGAHTSGAPLPTEPVAPLLPGFARFAPATDPHSAPWPPPQTRHFRGSSPLASLRGRGVLLAAWIGQQVKRQTVAVVTIMTVCLCAAIVLPEGTGSALEAG